MPNPNYIPSKRAQDDFFSWLSEYYGMKPSLLQMPDVLLRFGNKSNQYYQYWTQYVWTPAHPAEKPPEPAPKKTPEGTSVFPRRGAGGEVFQAGNTEKIQAWNEYQQAGGTLSISDWEATGGRTATDEGAANAWLDVLLTMLQAEIDIDPDFLAEAKLISDDMEDRLSGQGKYEGVRQTVLDLPSWVLTDVEDYRKSIPLQEQARLAAAQQRTQDIVSQQTQLPLNAGGTIPQQIQAGQRAMRNLQIQLEAAPEYMRGILKEQFAELDEGVRQLQETDLLMAKERSDKLEGEPTPPFSIGPLTRDLADEYSWSPEKIRSEAMIYQGNPESGDYANLTDKERMDLSAIAQEAGGIASEEEQVEEPTPVKPFEDIPSFRDLGATGSPAWKNWFERRYPTIVSQFRGKKETERTVAGFTTFLDKERARIKEEFTKQSPYARGERPSAFQPRIKTVGF